MDIQQTKKINLLSSPTEYFMADEWHKFAKPDHFWMKWRFDILKKNIPKEFFWGKTLEIGCGNGIAKDQIESYYGCVVSGCDLNISALRDSIPGEGELYLYDINQRCANFKEEFSTLLLFDVLEHIKDPVNFLKSAAFHLKPGGRIIINVPAFQLFYSQYDKVAGHLKRYNILLLNKELQLAGFSVERSTYWGLSMVPLILIRKLTLCFVTNKKVIKVGFHPNSKLINYILELFRKCECVFFTKLYLGTSLLVIAQKKLNKLNCE